MKRSPTMMGWIITAAAFLAVGTAGAEVITLTFDNVDDQIQCEEVWYEQGIALSFVPADANECGTGSCFFGIGDGEVWLYPCTLAVDLSEVTGVETIEIDFIDGCPHPNCENAYLYQGATVIDEDHDNNPMVVHAMDNEVDLLRVNGCEDGFTEIRIIGDYLVPNHVSSWGGIKAAYR